MVRKQKTKIEKSVALATLFYFGKIKAFAFANALIMLLRILNKA